MVFHLREEFGLFNHNGRLSGRFPAETNLSRTNKALTAPLLNARQQVCQGSSERMPRVTVGCSTKEPSLFNGHECRTQFKICSPLPVMARLQMSERFSSGTINKQTNKQTNCDVTNANLLLPLNTYNSIKLCHNFQVRLLYQSG